MAKQKDKFLWALMVFLEHLCCSVCHWIVFSWPNLWCSKSTMANLSLHMNLVTRNSIFKLNKLAGKTFNITSNMVTWKETTSENAKQVLLRGNELHRISESLGERVLRKVIRPSAFHFSPAKGLCTDRKGHTVMLILDQPNIFCYHKELHFWQCHWHILSYQMLHLSQIQIYCLERKYLKTGFMDSETKIPISLTNKAIWGQV